MSIFERRKLLSAATAALLLAAAPAAVAADMSLADALKAIQGSKMVDLTHSFGTNTPVWSGFGQATMTAAADPETHTPYTIPENGFRTIYYSMVGQYGTHVDPPAHFDEDGMTMDQIPVTDMVLPLVVFDMTPMLKDDPNHALTVEDVKAWEKEHGQVPKGSFAALRTDMYKDWDSDPEHFKRYPFPGWSLEAIQYLINDRGVTAIGHEALDTDATESMASETWLLKNGHYQIEVMANLDKVPETGSIIVVSWPKVKNGFGFPARAFAIVPQ